MESGHGACIAYAENAKAEADKWSALWPNHCKSCFGWASVKSDEPWFGSEEACGCVLENNCPRCGETGLSETSSSPCSSCGWNWGVLQGDTMPTVEIVCPHEFM